VRIGAVFPPCETAPKLALDAMPRVLGVRSGRR